MSVHSRCKATACDCQACPLSSCDNTWMQVSRLALPVVAPRLGRKLHPDFVEGGEALGQGGVAARAASGRG